MSEEQLYERNLDAMARLIGPHHGAGAPKKFGLELERVLVDGNGDRIFFSGTKGRSDDVDGVHAILNRLLLDRPEFERVDIDGHLMGLSYTFDAPRESIAVAISLEPGAQVEISAGPASHSESLLLAIESFDRELEAAAGELGVQASFAARGYDQGCSDPRDIELIPKDRYLMMNAYLPRHGRYARDMMRCSGSTQVSVDYSSEADAVRLARRATALGPVLSFLFDNAPLFRGRPSRGMSRSRMWREVDPERCGTIPGSLSAGFGFKAFCKWIASLHTILFADRDGVSTDAGDRVSADYMRDRELTDDELMHLISMSWPTFRFKGYLECREMDALPPRMAVACAIFTAAVLYCPDLEERLPFDIYGVDEAGVDAARHVLEDNHWDAVPYGVAVDKVAAVLAEAAVGLCADDADRAAVETLASMWAAHRLPRDFSLDELASMGR